jgi:hypothetical protein
MHFFTANIAMNFESPISLILGAFFLIVVGRLVATQFSPDAKLERRRRRNNARIVSKAGRPAVKLSAKTKK